MYLLSKLQNVQNNTASLLICPRDSYASSSSLATCWAEDRIQIFFALTLSLIRATIYFSDLFRRFTPSRQLRTSAVTFLTVQSSTSPQKDQWSALFPLPGSNCLEPAPCFCSSCYLCQLFQSFLENLFLFKTLSLVPLPWGTSVCVCVCVGGGGGGVRTHARVCVLNLWC